MPVSPTQILTALDNKRQDFNQFNRTIQQDLQRYRRVWRQLTQSSLAAVEAGLPPGRIGGRPLEPFQGVKRGVVPFGQRWDNREASLAWVRQRLTGVTTFAVDGSQIFPSKDVSLPVALVQIGWFENPHTADGDYHKDIQLDVLTPADLKTERMAEPVDRQVNIRRFQMEVQRLIDYMAHCQHPDHTLVFFDGSLVVTFADAFDPESQRAYVQAMVQLLAASDRYRVPLVGYVDTSYARDLTSLLPHWSPEIAPVEALHDAQMLSPMMRWGDRTPLFICDRDGILDKYGEHGDHVTFTYVQTTRDRPPARLELPRWVWETGQLERVVNWVRAEVIVGGGYPYAIETADQTAVLQGGDRQLFYRILQEWAERETLDLRFSRKMISKTRRR
jgi:hypothetical protein